MLCATPPSSAINVFPDASLVSASIHRCFFFFPLLSFILRIHVYVSVCVCTRQHINSTSSPSIQPCTIGNYYYLLFSLPHSLLKTLLSSSFLFYFVHHLSFLSPLLHSTRRQATKQAAREAFLKQQQQQNIRQGKDQYIARTHTNEPCLFFSSLFFRFGRCSRWQPAADLRLVPRPLPARSVRR